MKIQFLIAVLISLLILTTLAALIYAINPTGAYHLASEIYAKIGSSYYAITEWLDFSSTNKLKVKKNLEVENEAYASKFCDKDNDICLVAQNDAYLWVRNKANTAYKGIAAKNLYLNGIYIYGGDPVKVNGNLAVTGYINASKICLNTTCKTDWSQVGKIYSGQAPIVVDNINSKISLSYDINTLEVSGGKLSVKDFYVNTSGDTMSGNLDMNGSDIVNVDILSANKIDVSEVCLGGECKSSWPSGGNYWTLSGSNLYPTNANWNVGIGTMAPKARLHIVTDDSVTIPFQVDAFGHPHSNLLPGWKYRRPISVQERSGNTLWDYQVLVTLDTASLISEGKMRPDCGDIRFTDSDGKTLLDYWIESGCNSANTRIWVKVPYLTAGLKRTIYIYYGNSTATSISNKNATLDVWTGSKSKECWITSPGANCSVTFYPSDIGFSGYRFYDVYVNLEIRGDLLETSGAVAHDGDCSDVTWYVVVTINGGCVGRYTNGPQDCTWKGALSWPKWFNKVDTTSLKFTSNFGPWVDSNPGGCFGYGDSKYTLKKAYLRQYVDPEPSVTVGAEELLEKPQTVFYIQPLTGNVGIGTTNPTERLYVKGNIHKTGTVNFVEDINETHQLIYASLEGGEVSVYWRGSGLLKDGKAKIEFPEHFKMALSKKAPIVAIVTPTSPCQIYIKEKTHAYIVVESLNCKRASFDFLILGTRKGYENYKPIKAK